MKILLAVDVSPSSEVVVNEVASRSWPAGSSIEVLNVLDTAFLDSSMVDSLEGGAREFVAGVAGKLHATAVVLLGDPKSAIVDRAHEIGADMIVVGSHDPNGVERFFLGSVAKAVIRHASCSVIVARSAVAANAPRKILLATDGSETSEVAARSVAARTWPDGTEVRVLSVVEMMLNTFQAALEPPFLNTNAMEEIRVAAMKRAENAIAQGRTILSDMTTSESISVLVDSPKQIIIDEAETWGADLIVVGSHGSRGITRFLLGSVSEAVATHAHCSVEVIRKKA